ncbi:MAG: hypothetical protein HQL50_02300 [Magnetococcales bacterium]|nr:hypothetical protein [Magnetococcales bacterium]
MVGPNQLLKKMVLELVGDPRRFVAEEKELLIKSREHTMDMVPAISLMTDTLEDPDVFVLAITVSQMPADDWLLVVEPQESDIRFLEWATDDDGQIFVTEERPDYVALDERMVIDVVETWRRAVEEMDRPMVYDVHNADYPLFPYQLPQELYCDAWTAWRQRPRLMHAH